MRTTQTKLAAGLVPPAGPSLQDQVDSDGNRLVRWRLTLDSAWRRKMDEVIALSKVFCGLASDDDGNPAGPGVRASSRLEARTERAYDELVAIEDAIARIDDGTYGLCASCRQSMPDEWLADNPAVRYCPDCFLRRTSRQEPDLPGASPSASPRQARPKQGSGVRRRA
jgi:RNA polymerase-binding transcription factor DksA